MPLAVQATKMVPQTQPEEKLHGKNDNHIIQQIEKRFSKLRTLQDEKKYVQRYMLTARELLIVRQGASG